MATYFQVLAHTFKHPQRLLEGCFPFRLRSLNQKQLLVFVF
jgi:hypothetical protein